MPRTLYIVDAFTARPFSGNPAAVVFFAHATPEPDDAYLQHLARELNLSETAFVRLPAEPGGRFGLRWFTPAREIDLCGHATLAAAHALYDAGKVSLHKPVEFETRSGVLRASPDSDWRGFWLDFPSTPPREARPPRGLLEAMGINSVVFAGKSGPPDGADDQSPNDYYDWFLVAESAEVVRDLRPDFPALAAATAHDERARGVIVSAPTTAATTTTTGDEESPDVVSRCFYPAYGIDEDPVTGSAHCTITPYFARTLDRDALYCEQLSQRGGSIRTRLAGDRVYLGGRAVTTVRGQIVA